MDNIEDKFQELWDDYQDKLNKVLEYCKETQNLELAEQTLSQVNSVNEAISDILKESL